MKLVVQIASSVLKRPIILFDSYTAKKLNHILVFLPIQNPVLCQDSLAGDVSNPIVLSFDSENRDRFVPVLSFNSTNYMVFSGHLLINCYFLEIPSDKCQVSKTSMFNLWKGSKGRVLEHYVKFNAFVGYCDVAVGPSFQVADFMLFKK